MTSWLQRTSDPSPQNIREDFNKQSRQILQLWMKQVQLTTQQQFRGSRLLLPPLVDVKCILGYLTTPVSLRSFNWTRCDSDCHMRHRVFSISGTQSGMRFTTRGGCLTSTASTREMTRSPRAFQVCFLRVQEFLKRFLPQPHNDPSPGQQFWVACPPLCPLQQLLHPLSSASTRRRKNFSGVERSSH